MTIKTEVRDAAAVRDACKRLGLAEARKRHHTVTEQQLPDGSVRLTIQVGGGAA